MQPEQPLGDRGIDSDSSSSPPPLLTLRLIFIPPSLTHLPLMISLSSYSPLRLSLISYPSSTYSHRRVPERVAYLREVLDSDPSRLKEVFLESLKLESLRYVCGRHTQTSVLVG